MVGYPCEVHARLKKAEKAKLSLAYRHLASATVIDPDAARAYFLLGRVHCLLREPRKAVNAYKIHLALAPKSTLGNIELGFAHELNGDLEQAAVHWKAGGLEAGQFLERAYNSQYKGNPNAALTDMQRALAMGLPTSSKVLFLRYLIFSKKGETEKAKLALTEAVSLDREWLNEDTRIQAFFTLGAQYYTDGEPESAVPLLEEVISASRVETWEINRLSETYRFMGLISWGQDQLVDAVEYLKRAVEINPANPYAHLHYGKVLYLLDPANRPEVVSEFDTFLELLPENRDGYLNLVEFWEWVKVPDEAARICSIALEKWGTEPSVIERCQP
jgi:tetratricopeptide (TPR) repeat protein